MKQSSCAFAPVIFILAVYGIAGGTEAASQSVVLTGPDRITIDAENVTLAALFQELSEQVSIELLQISPEARAVRVSVQAEDVSPAQGIVEILEEAEVDYALVGGYGKPFRILIGSAESNTGRSPSAARPFSPDETPEQPDLDRYPEEPPPGAGSPPRRAGSERQNPSATEPDMPPGYVGVPTIPGVMPGIVDGADTTPGDPGDG